MLYNNTYCILLFIPNHNTGKHRVKKNFFLKILSKHSWRQYAFAALFPRHSKMQLARGPQAMELDEEAEEKDDQAEEEEEEEEEFRGRRMTVTYRVGRGLNPKILQGGSNRKIVFMGVYGGSVISPDSIPCSLHISMFMSRLSRRVYLYSQTVWFNFLKYDLVGHDTWLCIHQSLLV